MTTVITNPEVTRPTTTPLNSSVLDHARKAGNFHENVDRFGLRNNAGMWVSYNCLDLLNPTPMCPDPTLDEDGEHKQFDVAPWMPGFEFAVHGGVQCNAVGLDRADQKAEVARVFGLSEGKAIERALKANRFVARAKPAETGFNRRDLASWDAPQDITPASAEGVNLKQAMALLEGFAASRYVGIPTLHVPRAAASMISDMIQWRDDGLAYTPAGSKIAVGGGYDDEAMLLSGTWTLYATGEVYIEASKMIEPEDTQQIVVPGDGSLTKGNLSDNTVITLAERMYRVVIDCFALRIDATIF